jgi:ABC-2 type transport system permease protein
VSAALVVAWREIRDQWVSGRGLAIMVAYAVLLSFTTYVAAVNQSLTFLEQRESLSQAVKTAVTVGGLLVVLWCADAVSGERERGTLESLLLTPAPRRALVAGKGMSALTLWVGAFLVAVPYLWVLGRGVSRWGEVLLAALIVGTLLSLFLGGLGLLVSIWSGSQRLSLAISLFLLLALHAPALLPPTSLRGWAGEALVRLDPFTSGLPYLDGIVLRGTPMTQDIHLLLTPLVAGLVMPAIALAAASRLSLMPRGQG